MKSIMEFNQDEIVRVLRGDCDQGHGDEEGRVLEIERHFKILIANFPVDGQPEKIRYRIGFPPDRWIDFEKWYTEDQLEKV